MHKDTTTKMITGCLDVFSDICNVNLFNKEVRIHPDELVPMKSDSVYTDGKGKTREHRRDVCMKHIVSGVNIAIISLENQSDVCNIMPVRELGYLYSGYKDQIDKLKQENERKGKHLITKVLDKKQKLVPIISLVLYYGTKEWDGPLSVMDMLDIPERWKSSLEPLIANHHIRLVNLAKQNDETRNAYQSDFRHIVDYLHYEREKDKSKLEEFSDDETRIVTHPREFLMAMSAFTNDRRYEKMANKLTEKQAKEATKMCMMLDIREERGEKRGEKRGREIGEKQGMKRGKEQINQLILKLDADGRSKDIIRIAQDSKYEQKLLEEYGIL